MNWYTLALISMGIAIGIYLYDYLNNGYKSFKSENFDLVIICIAIFLIAIYIIFTEKIKIPF